MKELFISLDTSEKDTPKKLSRRELIRNIIRRKNGIIEEQELHIKKLESDLKAADVQKTNMIHMLRSILKCADNDRESVLRRYVFLLTEEPCNAMALTSVKELGKYVAPELPLKF